MPGFDYSRFDKIEASDSEDEGAAGGRADDAPSKDVLADLPPELSPELSLVLAARHGQENVVEALLDNRASPDSTDPHGATALHRAVEGGVANRKAIELLLRRRASIDARSAATGETPLTRAAATGPAELLASLLEAGSPVAECRGEALAAAASAGNRGTTKLLLTSKAPANVPHDGRLPLNRWAEHGCREVMEELLALRADVNSCDEQGTSPLACAVKSGSAAAVRWLCERGADVDWMAFDGRTALISAVEKASDACVTDIVGVLLEHRASPEAVSTDPKSRAPSPLVAASCAGRLAVARQLLAASAAPSAADAAGRRPLPSAAVVGVVDLCAALLDAGASVNDRGTSGAATEAGASGGATALSVSSATGDERLAELLLAAGADVEAEDERGMRPLMSAARGGREGLLRMLLAARAGVDAVQADTQKTALVFAAGAGSAEACTILLEAGANVEARAATGAAAVHAAAANGHDSVCRVLLRAGAVPSRQGPGGQDAIAIARAAGHQALGEMLASGVDAPAEPAAAPS